MSIIEDFRDPGTAILTSALGENPLAGSIFERQDIHTGDKAWQEDHQKILERENSRGGLDVLDAADLPTFYSGLRLLPISVLVATAGGMFTPLGTEFLKLRVCQVSLNISDDICAHINELQYKPLADQVVKQSAHYQLYITLVGTLIPAVFSVFVGSWSDRFGRKLPILLPFLGFFLSAIFYSVLSNYKVSPMYLLIPALLASLTGGWTILLMAMFSFIGDYTTDKNRSMNIAMIDGTLILTGNLGALLGGYLYQLYGFSIPFYICNSLHGVSFLYILFVIRDRIPRLKGSSGGCMELFSTSHLRDNITMLKQERTGNTRTHIYIVLFNLLLYSVCDSGDGSVTQLFVEFQPFNWNVTFYTLFGCITGLASSFSIVMCMIVFRKFLGISDTLVAFIGAFSAVLYFSGYGIARTSWILYLSASLGSMRALVIVSIRSLLSGMVEQNEIGKMMSLISSLQSLTPLLGGVVFNNIFAVTSSWYSGLCFVIAALLSIMYFAAFGYVDVVRRRSVYQDATTKKAALA